MRWRRVHMTPDYIQEKYDSTFCTYSLSVYQVILIIRGTKDRCHDLLFVKQSNIS